MELGRFRKRIWELETVFDKWMYLFKHIHEMITIPEVFKENEFERLFNLARIANFTPEEMRNYMHTFKQCDYYNVIATAEEESRAKGLAEGRAEGRADTIRQMLAAGIEPDVIANALGVPIIEIESMR